MAKIGRPPTGTTPRRCLRIPAPEWDFIGGVALRMESNISQLMRFAALRLADELNENPNGKAATAFLEHVQKGKK